ncbi:outer membrane beta-barrel protein [Shewanella sp. NIFS-20-20]|uniref:outer membrane beta-barrel protein n=1 Tax=Shewanella sp. NIFS-20-20 TaxID=2853806 RepID=UPI001C44CA2C|nr:outer membrane beta-barrel protein [Shewanella sp. NIFS-20-20]MBV7314439.1 porin family protein [Shewanella sp. NIFS-20-20]
MGNMIKSSLVFGVTCGLLLSTSSQASQWFFTPTMGYSFGTSDVELADTTPTAFAAIKEGEHWGGQFGMDTPDPGQVYLLYSHQTTDLYRKSPEQPKLTSLAIDYLHFGGSLRFPKGKLAPYITTSIGVTQLRPSKALSTETRFSMGIGAGMSYQIADHLSVQAEVRSFATFIDSNQQLFCDVSGCLWQLQADILWQSQANLGVTYRF